MKLPGKFSRKKKSLKPVIWLNWPGNEVKVIDLVVPTDSLILHIVIFEVKSALCVWYILMWDSNWVKKDHIIRGEIKAVSAVVWNLYVNTELTLFIWSCLSGYYADHLLCSFIGWAFGFHLYSKKIWYDTLYFTQHFSIHIQYETPEMIDIINKNMNRKIGHSGWTHSFHDCSLILF